MKISKIIAVVCWSLVAIILTGVLITTLAGGKTVFNPFIFINGDFSLESLTTSEEYKIPADKIENINVDWASGYVSASPCDGDEIIITERSSKKLNDDEKMLYEINGTTLNINYNQSNNSWTFLNFNTVNKAIDIKIPQKHLEKMDNFNITSSSADISAAELTLKEIYFHTTSGNVNLTNIITDNTKIETVSGDIKFDKINTSSLLNISTTSGNASGNATADKLNASSVSGDSKVTGKFKTVTSSSVSGDLSIHSAICPDSINLDTTSGNMKIEIPENNGFTLHFSSVSGDLKNDFPVTSSSGDYSIYKNGGSDIKMNSVSGDGNIIKS